MRYVFYNHECFYFYPCWTQLVPETSQNDFDKDIYMFIYIYIYILYI